MISGRCLSPGYLDRPELTASAYINNPFENSQFSRMYRTGDLIASAFITLVT